MRLLILTLLLIGVSCLYASKPCNGEDCNYGKRCYTDSQCDCDLVCLKVPGDPFHNKRCQF